ncbi:MAG: TIGR03960 family B12-binding radical SAM protein [Clostridia bacterium]|nr:TIGR03960 family B12-binding radical SAM protein [Clostridia bacterium]
MSLNKILKRVQKPARYIGNEYGSVHKNLEDISVRFAFCFPDTYEVGMSHLGMKILYHLLNNEKDVYCERVFAPWVDMEEEMRKEGLELFSLETKTPLKEFDMVGFTLQYEMSYSNILNMLDLANITKIATERGENEPFVCAGGPCAYNPEPIADFVDFFILGEGEEVNLEVIDAYRKWKGSGKTRKEFLESLLLIEGIYVPQFYDAVYNEDGTIKAFTKNNEKAPDKIKKRIIKDMDSIFYPEEIIVPFMEIVHDRITLELFRGCIRGCRFCQAGMIYRPVRGRSPERLLDLAEKLIKNTGYEEISMSSLSTSDYPELKKLTDGLLDLTEKKKISLSLPSLRLDSFSMELMQKVQKVRKSGLTFAPEAGTQRLRDVINKGITEEDLMTASTTAFAGGYGGVKLYFMIGLPTETLEDVEGINDLARKVVDCYYNTDKAVRNRNLKVTVSTSTFVPKPFTPFQWASQDNIPTVREKQAFLKEKIRHKNISYNWHDAETSILEGVFARGDRKLSKVLLKAQEKGVRFDGWQEYFNYDLWMEAFNEAGVDPDFYNLRERSYDEILPWDHIDVGVTKKFLENENEKAKRGEVTPNCREKCSNCGIIKGFGGGLCG